MAAGLSRSNGHARKDIEGGGVYVNGQRIQDSSRAIFSADLLHGTAVLFRKGKRSYPLLTAQ